MQRRRFLATLGTALAALAGCAVSPKPTKVTATADRPERTARTPNPSRSARPRRPEGTAPSRTPRATPNRHGELTVVALGDSVPFGSGCSCDNYVTLVGKQLATQRQTEVSIENLSVPGIASRDCLADVRNTADTRTAIADASVILLHVGANDLDPNLVAKNECYPASNNDCWSDDIAEMGDNVRDIIAECRGLNRDVTVLVLNYWCVVEDGAVGRAISPDFPRNADSITKLTNQTLSLVANEMLATYVDIYTPMKGEQGQGDVTGLLAKDGEHPNAEGHKIIADTVLEAIRRRR